MYRADDQGDLEAHVADEVQLVPDEEQRYTEFFAQVHTGVYDDRPVSHYLVDFPDRDTIRVRVVFDIGPSMFKRFSREKMTTRKEGRRDE